MPTPEETLETLVDDVSALTHLVDLNDDPAITALAARSTELAVLSPLAADLQASADARDEIVAAASNTGAAEAARDAAQAVASVTPNTAIGASTLENAIRARYKVSGRHPSVIVDPVNDVYFASSGAKGFGELINHTRNNAAVFTDHAGVIQVATSGTPRLRHHVQKEGIWQPAGLRFDGQATNFLETSEDFTSSIWGKENVTLIPGATTAPDGTNTATEMQFDHDDRVRLWNVRNAGDMTAPGILTFSVYVKRKTADWVRLVFNNIGGKSSWLWFNLATGVRGATRFESARTEMIPVGDGWYRISASMLADGALSGGQLEIAGADANDSTAANTGEAIYVWGAQAEVSPVPTSYIKTTGTAVTRVQDDLTIPAAHMPATAVGATFIFEGTLDWADDGDNVYLLKQSNLTGLMENSGSGNGQFATMQLNSSGAKANSAYQTIQEGVGIPYKIAFRFSETEVSVVVNGVETTAQHSHGFSNPGAAVAELLKGMTGVLSKLRVFDAPLPKAALVTETTLPL